MSKTLDEQLDGLAQNLAVLGQRAKSVRRLVGDGDLDTAQALYKMLNVLVQDTLDVIVGYDFPVEDFVMSDEEIKLADSFIGNLPFLCDENGVIEADWAGKWEAQS